MFHIPHHASHDIVLHPVKNNTSIPHLKTVSICLQPNTPAIVAVQSVQLFTDTKHFKSNYLVDKELFSDTFERAKGKLKNIALAIELDTEYVTTKLDDLNINPNISNDKTLPSTDNIYKKLYLTLQIKHIHAPIDKGLIFAYPEFETVSDIPVRHPVLKHPFFIGDYIEAIKPAWNVLIERTDEVLKLPVLTIPIYAYFALAELGGLCPDSDFQSDLDSTVGEGKITMKRRLSTGRYQATKMPWLITIDTGSEVVTYQIALQFIDASAIHGIASLKGVMANVGIATDNKDLMSSWITKMDEAYFEVPELFDTYALNDLCIYEILTANYEKIRTIYDSLGVVFYFKEPALTVGKLVAHLFSAVLAKKLNMPPAVFHSLTRKDSTEFFHKICGSATGNHLGAIVKTQTYLLAKVLGGRCKNNNPIVSVLEDKNLCDVDIGGAYGWAQSRCDYYLGHPVTYATSSISRNTPKLSLRAFLDVFKDDMQPLGWTMAFSTSKPLLYEQDLFQSRIFDPSSIKPIEIDESAEHNILIGETKYFTSEIVNGTLTSDLLDIIKFAWNKKQRDDFLDTCEVLSFSFYPVSLEQKIEEFITNFEKCPTWNRYVNNDVRLHGYQRIDTESNIFAKFNLGSEFINVLREERKKHAKKTPLNELFKLMVNTAYGSGISRFFELSNAIQGNNVTACVRAIVYLMEKSLNMFGSITDGQFFDMDKVLQPHPKRGLNSATFARLYTLNNRELLRKYHSGTLGSLNIPLLPARPFNGRLICHKSYKKYLSDGYQTCVNHAVKRHMITCFPNIELLKDAGFLIEMKEFASSLVLRSSADYSTNPYSAKDTKARGQELKKSKPHQAYSFINEQCLKTDDYESYNPALIVMQNIFENKHACKILPVALKMTMIKPTMYTRHYETKWQYSNLGVGDEIPKLVTANYLTLSQFTFRFAKQYKVWNREHERLKNKYSIGLELFFLNTAKSGEVTLDFQKMITVLDSMIRAGITDPFDYLIKQNPKMQNLNFSRMVPDCIKQRAVIREHLKRSINSAIKFDDVEFSHDTEGFDE